MHGIEFRRPITTALLAIALLATAGVSPSQAQDAGGQGGESGQNDDEGTNYGWLGLIGLAGLMPKKRRDDHTTTTHTR